MKSEDRSKWETVIQAFLWIGTRAAKSYTSTESTAANSNSPSSAPANQQPASSQSRNPQSVRWEVRHWRAEILHRQDRRRLSRANLVWSLLAIFFVSLTCPVSFTGVYRLLIRCINKNMNFDQFRLKPWPHTVQFNIIHSSSTAGDEASPNCLGPEVGYTLDIGQLIAGVVEKNVLFVE